MSLNLITDAELAAMFQIDVAELNTLRKRHRWPFVRMGRNNIRFTPEHVAQIVAKHTEAPATPASATLSALPDQTRASAARSRQRPTSRPRASRSTNATATKA